MEIIFNCMTENTSTENLYKRIEKNLYEQIEEKIKSQRDLRELEYLILLKEMKAILDNYEKKTITHKSNEFTNLVDLKLKILSLMDFHRSDLFAAHYIQSVIYSKKLSMKDIDKVMLPQIERHKFLKLFTQLLKLCLDQA